MRTCVILVVWEYVYTRMHNTHVGTKSTDLAYKTLSPEEHYEKRNQRNGKSVFEPIAGRFDDDQAQSRRGRHLAHLPLFIGVAYLDDPDFP